MKRSCPLILLVSLLASACGCHCHRQDMMGRISQGPMPSDGLQVTEERIYADEGVYRTETQYRNGKPHGQQIRYYPNGQMAFRRNWSDGGLDGEETWWRKDGTRMSTRHYRRNLPHGLTTTWYSNGQKAFEATYEDGKLVGTARTWYETGTPHVELLLADGLQTADCWPGLRTEGKHAFNPEDLNRRNGTITEWDTEGRLVAVTRYASGRVVAEEGK